MVRLDYAKGGTDWGRWRARAAVAISFTVGGAMFTGIGYYWGQANAYNEVGGKTNSRISARDAAIDRAWKEKWSPEWQAKYGSTQPVEPGSRK